MIRYEDVKKMPEEYWTKLKETLFEEFMDCFKQDSWYEVDTNELAERIIPEAED